VKQAVLYSWVRGEKLSLFSALKMTSQGRGTPQGDWFWLTKYLFIGVFGITEPHLLHLWLARDTLRCMR